MATVTFDGSRRDPANALTNWSSWGVSPVADDNFWFQGGYCISAKIKTSEAGFSYTDTSTVDYATTPKVWLCKININTPGAIDVNGVWVAIGNDSSTYYYYSLYPASTDYPATAGWQIVPIDPNVSGYRDGNSGTPALGTVDFYGVQGEFSITAKAENVGIDAVDYIDSGTGLSLDGTSGDFSDFSDYDYGTTGNRYGIVLLKDGIYTVTGVLTIGSSTLTTFSDSNQTLVFPDGRVNTGFFGVDIDLQNASTAVTLDTCVFNGRGSYGADGGTADTRPDFEVSGTSGSATVDGCSFLNHRNITFTSAASMDGGRIECRLLTQNSADIENVTIVTDSLTSIACLQDPTFGTTTDLHDVDFVQGGAGHAIELDTATSYTLTNINFSGYGADTTDSAALDITASSGTVTVNVVGGNTPTYKTAGATVSIVLNPVTTTIHAINSNGDDVVGARILVWVSDDTNYPYQDSVSIVSATGTATVTHTAHGLATDDHVLIEGCTQPEYNGAHKITVSGVDTYTYTVLNSPSSPATGSPISTYCLIDADADANGEASSTKSYGSGDQPITGRARKGSATVYYKTSAISGTVDSDSGVTITVVMIEDE